MSFDRDNLEAMIARHGPVARVVITSSVGSVPRGTGTSMLVWKTGQSGTIGGGALEFTAAERARGALEGSDRYDKIPLGPDLGQCCGGGVTLLTEIWNANRLAGVGTDHFSRPLPGTDSAEMPLKLAGLLRRVRSGADPIVPQQVQGWFIEPVMPEVTLLWIWGAGHVGRALVNTLAPLPEFSITWVDDAPARFPDVALDGITCLPAPDMATAMQLAPSNARHLILTYSHEIDLALCHAALIHGFADCGLIGSATKWARFKSRLAALGHTPNSIAQITCPIGDPGLGKHPQAIAVGVANRLLKDNKVMTLKASGGETLGRNPGGTRDATV